MAKLRAHTEEESLTGYGMEGGDNGLFLLDEGRNGVGYVPYGRLRTAKRE